ncbi:MAG: hypothetical protein WDN04_00710 [Rhodospirillales bacterium]
MSQSGGSPIKYRENIVHPPAPPPAPPVTLYISADVLELATYAQRVRIAEIELEFSHRVSKEMAKAYAEVLAVLRDKSRDEL